MNRSVVVSEVFLSVVIVFSSGIVGDGESELVLASNNGVQMVLADSYTPHEPIVISSNTDFSNQGWPGHGNLTHPYFIEDDSYV